MATRIAAEFTLTGFGFNPDEVTISLGVQPTRTWRQGDPRGKTLLRHKSDGWELSTGYEELDEENSIDMIKQIRSIFGRLQPHTSKLKEMCARLKVDARVCCVMHIEGDDRPAIYFDRDIVKWLAELGADIDIDLYVVPSERA